MTKEWGPTRPVPAANRPRTGIRKRQPLNWLSTAPLVNGFLARHAPDLPCTVRFVLWGVEEIGLLGSRAYVAAHAGELDLARDLTRKNLAAFDLSRVDAIVVNSAGCGAVLREAERWFPNQGEVFAASVRDICEFLEAAGVEPPPRRLEARVCYDDPCHLVHGQRVESAPGSVAQVRESAAQLVRFAKQTQTNLFLVGHVTKEGTLAGPRVLEHMVDTVLYFEGERGDRYRVIRAIKNRFGAVNELGVFAMTDKGLREVSNPSAIFLSRHEQQVPGSCILVTREGTRPLLVEVQALVDPSQLGNPRRVTLGLEQNRLSMLLAVLQRTLGVVDDNLGRNLKHGLLSSIGIVVGIAAFTFEGLLRADWPVSWSIPGEIDAAHDNHLETGSAVAVQEFGTQRYHVRIELYRQEDDMIPERVIRSWGVADLRPQIDRFPTVAMSLPGARAM